MVPDFEIGHTPPPQRPKPPSPLRIALPPAVAVGAFAVLVFVFVVPYVEGRFIALKKACLANLTDTAVSVLDSHYRRIAAEGLATAEAQRAAVAQLRAMRFGPGGKDYFWINDLTPRMVMHPYRPDLEGEDVSAFADPDGKRLFAASVEAVAGAAGAGYVDYTWQWQDDPARLVPKISHVRLFRPWGWVVGTGIYIEDVRAEMQAMVGRLVYGGLAVIALCGLLAAWLAWQGARLERRHREAWQALHRSREEQRAVLESTPHPVVVYDLEGRARYINPAFTRTFGWGGDELLGGRIDFVPEEERAKTAAGIRQAFDQGYAAIETRRLTRDGRVMDVQISAATFRDADGVARGMVVNLVDITARKQAEEALRAGQELFQAIGASARDVIVMIDDTGRITYWNQAGETVLGYGEAQAMGRNLHRLIAPERYLDTYQENFGLFQETGKGSVVGRTVELAARHRDGHEVPVELSIASVPFRDRWHAVGILRDITARRQAEAALRDSEEKYRRLVDHANDAIFITQDGVIKFPNPKMIAACGYDADELGRIGFADLIHPDDRAMIAERHRQRLRGELVPAPVTFRIFNRAGELMWVELNAVTVEWEGRPAVLNFVRDITEKKRLELEIQQARRLESLGTLAGGIAHDFNNLLMGILGNTTLLLADLDPADPAWRRLQDVQEQVRSGAELTRQLLGFARGGRYEVQSSDLNELVRGSVELFGRTHKELTIDADYPADLWPVEVDRGQLGQVLLNLLVNAWQSMPGGGRLTVATANAILDEEAVAPYGLKPGRYVKIRVSDTGVGMDEATRERIFEPFFTTRRIGRGTGLGLASSYGIIRNHGGVITVASEKGAGSTFEVYLPAGVRPPQREASVEAGPVPGGGETILLVDDEPMILEVGRELLSRLGYRVHTADGGRAALEFFGRRAKEIDLVILDMIMPEMSGEEVFDALRAIDPQARVLLSSGYSENGEAKKIMARGCNGFIQKPFDLKALGRRIREILEHRGGSADRPGTGAGNAKG